MAFKPLQEIKVEAARKWMIAHGYYDLKQAEAILAAIEKKTPDADKTTLLSGVRLMIKQGWRRI